MPKGDKYIGLTNYLKAKAQCSIVMSFSEIETQIGDKLPESAYKHRAFWSNTRTHSVAYGWMDAGYETVGVNINNQLITFQKA